MYLTPGIRKLALTAHVTFSVGWLGAVAAFLALAVTGLTSRDVQLVRAAYLAMESTGWLVIVPLCVAALLSGVIQSLGTTWGLFRHYWVVVKLVITVLATILLVVHMRPITMLANAASETNFSAAHLHGLKVQVVFDAGAALLALLVATTLSIYKPQGLTGYGRRKLLDQGIVPERVVGVGTPRWLYAFGITAFVLVLVFVIKHLAGGGLVSHLR